MSYFFKLKGHFLNIIMVFLLIIIVLGVATNIFFTIQNDDFLKSKIKTIIFPDALQKPPEQNYTGSEKDRVWAKKVLKGGYILFIRHAQRSKGYKGTGLFEMLEVHVHGDKIKQKFDGENRYYNEAVCLNKQGKMQAKAMGEIVTKIDLAVGIIISSPVCRARQTAEIMFGGYDKIDPVLVYSGINYETLDDRFSNLRDFFNDIPIEDNKNTVITAHGNVIVSGLFENPTARNLKIDEGGIIVLSRNDGKVTVEHAFHKFNSLARPFFVRK